MSPRSSSDSWSGVVGEVAGEGVGGGGGGGKGAGVPDIIDLDRFMRAGVRPSVRRKDDKCERLVVDAGAGGIGRKPAASERSSSSVESVPRERDKRYSHDSGLSDGSYVRRRPREHRRTAAAVAAAALRVTREREPGSSNSMRSFRAACERALRDQQEQIARVAQICERLTVHPASAPPPAPPARKPPAPSSSSPASLDSSDLSSSSRSTRDPRRRDKRRAAECKTYKIIMSKLDELNRLFAARGRSPPSQPPHVAPPPLSQPPRAAPPPPSSGSVSVSDKLVSTEPAPRPGTAKLLAPSRPVKRRVVERATGESESTRRSRLAALRTLDLDIAPQQAAAASGAGGCAGTRRQVPRLNVTTESVMKRETSSGSGSGSGTGIGTGSGTGTLTGESARDTNCKFDLDDPVHLYAQAKRLQALHARTRRARSASSHSTRRYAHEHETECAARPRCPHAHAHAHAAPASLCALCRGYWKALTNCLATQLFSKVDVC